MAIEEATALLANADGAEYILLISLSMREDSLEVSDATSDSDVLSTFWTVLVVFLLVV